MSTIGGNVCIRNGNELDYCWRECIQSLLPVCDEVVVCDAQSTDGTLEEIRAWMEREPKIKLCIYEWPNPKGDPDFWVKWLNYSREHLHTDWHLELDADEILSEKSYPIVRQFCSQPHRRSAWCTRWNFWRDHRHTIPEGVCLGKHVVRLAPRNVWLPSDGPHPHGAEAIAMAQMTGIEIFHYGFLRMRAPLFAKEKLLQRYFFDGYDERMVRGEAYMGNWMEMPGICGWENRVDKFDPEHPAVIRDWLKQRGYG